MSLSQLIETQPDYDSIKVKQNAAWSSGDYARIGITLQIVGEELAEAAAMKPGSTVLDVAAGNGNASLAFARRWCDVTSTDYVESLLQKGRARAAAEGLDMEFQVDALTAGVLDRTLLLADGWTWSVNAGASWRLGGPTSATASATLPFRVGKSHTSTV